MGDRRSMILWAIFLSLANPLADCRLCSLAAAGEVLVSTGMVYLAPHVEGITFEARGQVQLKGLDGPTPILLAAPTKVIEAGNDASDSADR